MKLKRWLLGRHGAPNLLSTSGSFRAPIGERFDAESVDGYYIDFRSKPEAPHWPPPWLGDGKGGKIFVAAAQWGLGAFEHYLATGDEAWFDAARGAADHLLAKQERDGRRAGGWVHDFRYSHSFPLTPPWLSGMAQGEGASLLARIAVRTGEERYAEAVRAAMLPMHAPAKSGGVRAEIGGTFFPEEYPTQPPSHVLNGGIFALWGCRDAFVLLGHEDAGELWSSGLETLCREIHRYDVGYWSRYDLFDHPLVNVASSMYHQLHIDQLRATLRIANRSEIEDVASRFEAYAERPSCQARAFAHKAAFRLAVPRNELITHRLPWSRTRYTR